METMQEAAIVTAINIENRSLGFYRAVASKVNDSKTKRIFELLAKEEAEHLESFCTLYQGNDDELVDILNANNIYADPYYSSLLDSIDCNTSEKDALQIALGEEEACIEWYTVFANAIRAPHIREIFVKILNDSSKHGELIAEEYMRLMNMVDRADQDIFVRE
jgi:rubrerythrin